MTDHIKNQLCARIEELEAEKMELNEQLDALQIERDALAKRLNGEGVSHDNTMTQRDYAEEMADKLSLAIVGITGRDIGEHSSANCPWRNAVEFAEEYESERDALAAHVEFCHKVLSMIENGPAYLVARQYRALRMARERKPETSLARLKAEWQAAAMEGWLEQMRYMEGLNTFDCMDSAEVYAEGLRRQAEGSEV